MTPKPTVSVVIPTFNEERHLAATLLSVRDQTYDAISDVIVVDGMSTDKTRDVAAEFDFVRVIDNPERIQSAGLNRALRVARGDIVVRVDGHCLIADDYVERCVEALAETRAAIVGGGMSPKCETTHPPAAQRAIAAAMASRLGAGPARFHVGGSPAWVDTVYLGAYRADDARSVGGYAQDVGVNEDAEFAIRMQVHGGIWFDPRIRSTYVPRSDLRSLGRQFFRYGRSRATTALRHPRQIRPRQLAAPALVLGLLGRHRRLVAAAYASLVLGRASYELTKDSAAAAAFVVALPVMHLSWGLGFLHGLVSPPPAPSPTAGTAPERGCERSPASLNEASDRADVWRHPSTVSRR